MKFVLYGMPCAGKTTLLNALKDKLKVVSGSSWLYEQTQGRFSSLPEEQQAQWRVKYTQYLQEQKQEHLISDGHYAFEDQVVFTAADGDCYDVFLYLYCDPEVLIERLALAEKNQQFAHLSVAYLAAWQQRELYELREQCHLRNKDFYVLPANRLSIFEVMNFIDAIVQQGFSSYHLAFGIVEQIRGFFPEPCTISLVDGDKTLINEDSFRQCAPCFKTSIFDGNFYTGYQSYCFDKLSKGLVLELSNLASCSLNTALWPYLKHQKFVILSAGISDLWDHLAKRFNLPYVIASPLISADTKYYVAKGLKSLGYKVIGYGDSQNDWYLLHEADEGYLCLGSRMSRSLIDSDVSQLNLLYLNQTVILAKCNKDPQYAEIMRDIAICKSSSGITGAPLAQAHFNLGLKLGAYIKRCLPHKNIPVLTLERGGRFFGDGIYMSFGGKFYPINPKTDKLPELKSNLVLIVDSVINTGNSLLCLIAKLKQANPKLKVCLATNVIQEEALSKFKDHTLFAVRVSANKFVGKRQKKQVGNSGPDTADRLFNLIED